MTWPSRTVVIGVAAAVLAIGVLAAALLNDGDDEADAGPAGEVENPIGSVAPTSADATTPTSAAPTDEGSEPDDSSDDAPTPSGPPTEYVIEPPAMALVSGSADVTGMGSSVLFGIGQETYFPADPETTVIEVSDASCALTNPFILTVEADETFSFDIAPDGFTAGFRSNQFNHVSLGVSEGVIAGGFSAGGELRSGSQQWPLEGGDFDLVVIWGGEGDLTESFTIFATWSGLSIENYTGEEAAGSVKIICNFVLQTPFESL